MKRSFIISMLALLPFLQSCSETLDPLFFVTVEREFDIPTNLNTLETHFFQLKSIPVRLDENLSLYNRSQDDVVSINPGDAALTAGIGNVDFTFIERIEVFVVSRLDSSLKRRVFHSYEPDFSNRSKLVLFNSFIDIQDIIKEGLIDLEVRIKTRTFVPGNVKARLTFNYAVFDTE